MNDTTRPEPAADAVERAAEAIYWELVDLEEADGWASLADEFDCSINRDGKNFYRDTARAALAAVPTEQTAAGDDLDALLDSVWGDSGPVEIDDLVWSDAGNQWSVWIKSCYTFRHVDADHPLYHVEHGTGPTRREAIQDAVRRATERGE